MRRGLRGGTEIRALIVVDDDVDYVAVQRLLADDCELLRATTGAEALQLCMSAEPDCVFLDYDVPDEAAEVLIAKLCDQGAGVVVLTSRSDERVILACLRAGAHDYLRKHELSADVMLQAMRNAIQKASLQRNLRLYKGLIEHLPTGASVLSRLAQGAPLQLVWNNSAALDTGLLATPTQGSDVEDVFVPEVAGHVRVLAAKTLERGDNQELGRPVGSPETTQHMLRTVALGPDTVAVLLDDVTERERMAKEFLESQRMESIGRLAGAIAHDFNNALSVIMSHTWFVRAETPVGHPLIEDLDAIVDAGRHATALTNQLLTFSRKRSQKIRVCDLNHVVDDMHRMMARILGEDVTIERRAESEPWLVRIDPAQIEQVILNLAVNARDAMGTGGRLQVSTSNVHVSADISGDCGARIGPGRYVVLRVRDNGCGMDSDTLSRIYEPFFSTKRMGKGTGLGLSTVYGIVKQSGGYIRVSSELGSGTEFAIYLPVVDQREDARPVASDEIADARCDATILLVEDERRVRSIVARVLRKYGFNVLEAGHADDAVQVADMHTGAIDLMVTDVVMPDVSGPRLAKRMRQLRPSMRVLYISGYPDDELAAHGVGDNGWPLLPKPFSPLQLINGARAVLGRPERRQ